MENLQNELDYYEREARGILRHAYDDTEIDGMVDTLVDVDGTRVHTICDELQQKGTWYFHAAFLLSRVKRVRAWLAGVKWKSANPDDVASFAVECLQIGGSMGCIMHDALRPFADEGRKFRIEGPKRSRTRVNELHPILDLAIKTFRMDTGRNPSISELYNVIRWLLDHDCAIERTIQSINEEDTIYWKQANGSEKKTLRRTVENYLSDYRRKYPISKQ